MSTINYQQIGQRIKKIRKERGLTQEEAAECCDITPSFYGNIERGDKKMSVETLAKIAIGLSASSDYLLFGEDGSEVADLLFQIREHGNESQRQKYTEIMKAVSKIIEKL